MPLQAQHGRERASSICTHKTRSSVSDSDYPHNTLTSKYFIGNLLKIQLQSQNDAGKGVEIISIKSWRKEIRNQLQTLDSLHMLKICGPHHKLLLHAS